MRNTEQIKRIDETRRMEKLWQIAKDNSHLKPEEKALLMLKLEQKIKALKWRI